MNEYNSILIETIQSKDLPVLRELFLLTRRTAFTWIHPSSFQLQDFDRETEGETILVARMQDRILGFISIWMSDHFIHHLYVSPTCYRSGIGSALLNKALVILNGKAFLKCMVQNVNAIQFYLENKFVESGRGEAADGEYILFRYEKLNNND